MADGDPESALGGGDSLVTRMVTWQMVTRSHSAYLTWSAVSSAVIGVETGHNDGHIADGALVTHSI